MEQYRLQLVEQPLRAMELEGMAFVRSHISRPVLADESMWRWQDRKSLRSDQDSSPNVPSNDAALLFRAFEEHVSGDYWQLVC